MNWSAFVSVIIVVAVIGIVAGAIFAWYRRKQHEYTHGTVGMAGFEEEMNVATGGYQMIKVVPQTAKLSFLDRLLMKRAVNLQSVARDAAGEILPGKIPVYIPRSFPDVIEGGTM